MSRQSRKERSLTQNSPNTQASSAGRKQKTRRAGAAARCGWRCPRRHRGSDSCSRERCPSIRRGRPAQRCTNARDTGKGRARTAAARRCRPAAMRADVEQERKRAPKNSRQYKKHWVSSAGTVYALIKENVTPSRRAAKAAYRQTSGRDIAEISFRRHLLSVRRKKIRPVRAAVQRLSAAVADRFAVFGKALRERGGRHNDSERLGESMYTPARPRGRRNRCKGHHPPEQLAADVGQLAEGRFQRLRLPNRSISSRSSPRSAMSGSRMSSSSSLALSFQCTALSGSPARYSRMSSPPRSRRPAWGAGRLPAVSPSGSLGKGPGAQAAAAAGCRGRTAAADCGKQAGQVVHPHPAVSVPQNAHMREIRLQRERGFHTAVDRQLPLRRRTAEGGIDGGIPPPPAAAGRARRTGCAAAGAGRFPATHLLFSTGSKTRAAWHRPQADQQGKKREQENNRQREQRQIACIHAVKHERQQQRYAVSEPSFDHTRRLSALDGRICQRIAGRGAVRRMLVSTS